jgi:hypothetical protein
MRCRAKEASTSSSGEGLPRPFGSNGRGDAREIPQPHSAVRLDAHDRSLSFPSTNPARGHLSARKANAEVVGWATRRTSDARFNSCAIPTGRRERGREEEARRERRGRRREKREEEEKRRKNFAVKKSEVNYVQRSPHIHTHTVSPFSLSLSLSLSLSPSRLRSAFVRPKTTRKIACDSNLRTFQPSTHTHKNTKLNNTYTTRPQGNRQARFTTTPRLHHTGGEQRHPMRPKAVPRHQNHTIPPFQPPCLR